MRRHSHRHRLASRRPTLLQRVASATVLVLGISILIGLCLLSPTGWFLLACGAVVLVLWTLVKLSYFAGRAIADVYNSCALHAGRAGLEKLMRIQHGAPRTP